MNADRLWLVWNRLNLWPWISLLVAASVIVLGYALSTSPYSTKLLSQGSIFSTSEEASLPSSELNTAAAAPGAQTLALQAQANSAAPNLESSSEAMPPSSANSVTAYSSGTVKSRGATAASKSTKPFVTLDGAFGRSAKTDSGFKDLAGKRATDIYIPTGSVFRAQLIMPIKTSVQERFVMAQTTHEFQDPSHPSRRIPVGSRLIGRASLNSALRGVDVRFQTLVSPKGVEYPIQATALSKQLFAELNGIFFSNELETYSTVMAFGFIEGFADAAKERETTVLGQRPTPTVTNQVLEGVGSSSFRVADEIMNDIRRRAIEYVVVPSGEQIFAVFTEKFSIPDGKRIE